MNSITELINKLKELNDTDAIGYSAFKELMVLARTVQAEGGK